MKDFIEDDVNNKTVAKREVNNTVRLDILYICVCFILIWLLKFVLFFPEKKKKKKIQIKNTVRSRSVFFYYYNLVRNSSKLIFYQIIVLPIYRLIRHYQRMFFQTRRKGISTTRNGTFTMKLKKMKMMIPWLPLIQINKNYWE